MGKFMNALMLVVVLNIGMKLFLGSAIVGNALWDLIISPENWGQLTLLSLFTDTMFLVGGTAIIIGTFFTKSDFLVFAGFAITFLSFGVGIAEFYQLISQTTNMGANSMIATMIVAPMIILYVYTLLKFWRGTD